MNKIAISACLLGEKVRYNGKSHKIENEILSQLIEKKLIISICPEIIAGFSVPRLPAEIIGGDGFDVIKNKSKIIDISGRELTDKFLFGSEKALKYILSNDIKIVILKDGSPSCGSTYIYDGNFNGVKHKGCGIFCAFLLENNIKVYNDHLIDKISTNIINHGLTKAFS